MNNPLNVADPFGLCCVSNDANDANDVQCRCYRGHIDIHNANLSFQTSGWCWPLTKEILNGLFGGSRLNNYFPRDFNEENCPPGQHCEWGSKTIFGATVELTGFTIDGSWIGWLIPDFRLPLFGIPLSFVIWPTCKIHVTGSFDISGWFQWGKCVPE